MIHELRLQNEQLNSSINSIFGDLNGHQIHIHVYEIDNKKNMIFSPPTGKLI